MCSGSKAGAAVQAASECNRVLSEGSSVRISPAAFGGWERLTGPPAGCLGSGFGLDGLALIATPDDVIVGGGRCGRTGGSDEADAVVAAEHASWGSTPLLLRELRSSPVDGQRDDDLLLLVAQPAPDTSQVADVDLNPVIASPTVVDAEVAPTGRGPGWHWASPPQEAGADATTYALHLDQKDPS